jgi:hypothetical protein
MLTHIDLRFFEFGMSTHQLGFYLTSLLKKKAFYTISIIGLITYIFIIFSPKNKLFHALNMDRRRLRDFALLVACVLILGLIAEKDMIRSFGLLWFVVFLALLPLEWIFQTISRLRSRRNFIYMIYVLVCLLDSHFEGRIRMLYNFYQSPPDIVEFLTRENRP